MSEQLSIRQLAEGDEALLIHMAAHSYESILTKAAANKMLATPNSAIFIAQQAETVIGFCYFHILTQWYTGRAELFLYDIEIKALYRRRGYGRQLFEAVKRVAKTKGIMEIWLLVSPGNETAVSFYLAVGGQYASEEAQMISFKVS